MSARTIYIVDDNADFRRSAQWWLASAGYDVVDWGDPAAALDALGASPPAGSACLLLDVRMPGMSGLDLHDRLRERGVKLPVVYMTGHGDVPLAVQAMQKGAVSFIEKPFAEEALEAALARAFETPAPPVAEPYDEAKAEWQQRLARLTPRERELLGWVIEDKLNKTIADLMGISIKTVELHRKRVMDKLGAASATHLIKMVVSERVV
jgi:two-component system, LuxR family, response regulator FixJ